MSEPPVVAPPRMIRPKPTPPSTPPKTVASSMRSVVSAGMIEHLPELEELGLVEEVQ